MTIQLKGHPVLVCTECGAIHVLLLGPDEIIFCECGATIWSIKIQVESKTLTYKLIAKGKDRNFQRYLNDIHSMDDSRLDFDDYE